jgi:hypothetical protein
VTGLERTMRALAGAVVTPPACGATFVPTEALPRPIHGESPASALARAYADAELDFAFVPSWEPWSRELSSSLRGAGIAVLWAVPGVLSTALSALGHSAGLRALGRDPDSLTPALDSAEEAMLAALEDGVSEKADATVVCDDLAGAAGPLASPGYLAESVLPRLARAVAVARSARLACILHSDGNVSALLGDIENAGFAALHVAGVSEDGFLRLFTEARKRGLTVVGGLGAQTLSHGVAGGVRTGGRLAALARTGPLLVADDGGITTLKEYSALLAAFSAVRGRL